MNNNDFRANLVDILRRADRMAAYRESGHTISPSSNLNGGNESSDQDFSRLFYALRTAVFGMALFLVAIFVLQIGLAGESATHRWVFFATAGALAVIGSIYIDRGNRMLVSS